MRFSARQVKIAINIDGSTSVGSDNFETEKEFAKSLTASFAESNLFANGGSAFRGCLSQRDKQHINNKLLRSARQN